MEDPKKGNMVQILLHDALYEYINLASLGRVCVSVCVKVKVMRINMCWNQDSV